MITKSLLLTLLCIVCAVAVPMSNNWAVYLAQINMVLPGITAPFGNGTYIKFSNGTMVDHKGVFYAATIYPRVVNGDFNGDGYADAAVIINAVWSVAGWNNNWVFVVLQDYANGPKVTNGVQIGLRDIYNVTVFSSNVDNNKIILQFLDRNATNPFGGPPDIPTVQILKVSGTTLSIESSKTFGKDCYPGPITV
jgi:hypothetical protein